MYICLNIQKMKRLISYLEAPINRLIFFIKSFDSQSYNDEDIRECIKMYWQIRRDITTCYCMSEMNSFFIDLEIYNKKFKNKVPSTLLDTHNFELRKVLSVCYGELIAGKKKHIKFA